MNLSSRTVGANQRKKREPQFLLNYLKSLIFKNPRWGFSPICLILPTMQQRSSIETVRFQENGWQKPDES